MRDGPSATVLSAAASWGCKISSWLGGRLLEDVVPISGGRVSGDATQRVQESLRITVPRFTVEDGRTIDWKPSAADSPLARYGQILDVTVIAGDVDGRVGRFLITDWVVRGGSIDVTASGLLQAPADDRLTVATAPRDDGTLKSEFLRLLPEYMTATFDPTLVDRDVPRSMQWNEDRLGDLYEIADAWPARIRMSPWGQVLVLPPLPDTSIPVLSLTDGEGGTIVEAPPSDSREGSYNMVVARSSANGVDAQAIAAVQSGPMAPTGDYHPKPKFFSSPLLPDEAACAAAAQSMLAEALRPSRQLQVTMAPDPRPELDDPVEIITDKGTAAETRDWGYVTGYDLPLTPSDGTGRLNVAIF